MRPDRSARRSSLFRLERREAGRVLRRDCAHFIGSRTGLIKIRARAETVRADHPVRRHIVRTDAADRKYEGFLRQYRAPGLQYGRRKLLRRKHLEAVGARIERRERLGGSRDAWQADEPEALGFAHD